MDSKKYIDNLTLNQINEIEGLSARAFNICESYSLINIKLILDYYLLHKSFKGLKNCGEGTDQELINLSVSYLTKFNINNQKSTNYSSAFYNLKRDYRDLLNNLMIAYYNNLSPRSRNGLETLLNDKINIRKIIEQEFFFDFNKIKNTINVGKKTFSEIKDFVLKIREYIIIFSKATNLDELRIIRNEFLLKSKFNDTSIDSSIIYSKSVFILISKLIDNQLLYKGNDQMIFLNLFNLYNNRHSNTMNEVAAKIKLTRERVRQIRNNIANDLSEKLSFLEIFKQDFQEQYNLDIHSSTIDISEKFIELINDENGTSYSKTFLTYIISFFYAETHKLVGNLSDVLLVSNSRVKGRYNWKDIYLVENGIMSNFHLDNFMTDLFNRLEERNDETYKFNFKSYLLRFIKDFDLDNFYKIFNICDIIIKKEFNLNLDINDDIVFHKNTIKQVHEYAIDALNLLNKPSKVEEIFTIISQIDPLITKSAEALRGSLQRKNNGLIFFGRESLYGLEIWETERTNIKGGTIRSIACEYLNKYDEPKHFTEIADFVIKYRPKSTEKSIYNNLKIEESGIFLFYKDSYVGLKDKVYSEKFILLKNTAVSDRRSWEERFIDLQKFISLENRLPFSHGVPKEELLLYRWFYNQKKSMNKLSDRKRQLLTDIICKYPSFDKKRKQNYLDKYDELLNFVNHKKRYPSASIKEEANLYSFFYKQKILYQENKLKESDKEKYTTIVKIKNDQYK